MALIYNTTMSPGKLELIAGWLPTRPWFTGDTAALRALGAYRFDDPEGAVGLEGHILSAGEDKVYHVPLAYRGAPLPEGDEYLVGTSEHGVLGTRWIIDGAGDPVFRTVLAGAIARGESGAELMIQGAEGEPVRRELSTLVRGSGAPEQPVPEVWAASVSDLDTVTIADTGFATLRIARVLGSGSLGADAALQGDVLRATWPGQGGPVAVAALSVIAPD